MQEELLALACNYAKQRRAFGALLSQKPLHVDTLAQTIAESEACFHLAFFYCELLGKAQTGAATSAEETFLRLLTPIAKLTTGKQVVQICSETIECFGGAGYVEDTGLPVLLRDAQVLPIWEGTTNVLSLDALRALSAPDVIEATQSVVSTLIDRAKAGGPTTSPFIERSAHAIQSWQRSLSETSERPESMDANARRSALTFGRALELLLLAVHAAETKTERALQVARRFAASPIDLVVSVDAADSRGIVQGYL